MLAGTTLTTRALSPADGIAYVTYITPPARGLVLTAPTMIKARAVATLCTAPSSTGACTRSVMTCDPMSCRRSLAPERVLPHGRRWL